MQLLDNILRSILERIGIESCKDFVCWIARLTGIDLLSLAHNNIGIMKYQNFGITGEDYFIKSVLPHLISSPNPVFVDVGANVGDFSKFLRLYYSSAKIYAFEPVGTTFERLQENLCGLDIHCVNIGLGSTDGMADIYVSARAELSPHASLYQDVAHEIHQYKDIFSQPIQIKTLDGVAFDQSIDFINLLKVDTEGCELEVLHGAKKLIQDNRVGVILFEFNEMNTVSRTFLRDFYEELTDYKFYRLDSHRLISLGRYQPRNEIFQFQNIVAINSVLHQSETYVEEWRER